MDPANADGPMPTPLPTPPLLLLLAAEDANEWKRTCCCGCCCIFFDNDDDDDDDQEEEEEEEEEEEAARSGGVPALPTPPLPPPGARRSGGRPSAGTRPPMADVEGRGEVADAGVHVIDEDAPGVQSLVLAAEMVMQDVPQRHQRRSCRRGRASGGGAG